MTKISIKSLVIAVLAVCTISLSSCKKKEEAPAPVKGKDTTVVETAKDKALKILKANTWVAESIEGPSIDMDGVIGLVTAIKFADQATVYKSGDLKDTMGGQSESASYALSDDAGTLTVGSVDYTIGNITAEGFTLTDKNGNVYKFAVADA